MYEGDGRLRKARMLEEQAAILRKEVERDELRESEGVMSKAYREANEALSDMRIAWNRLYGGSYL